LELKDGTPVKLKTTATISSVYARPGQRVNFEVVEDVFIKTYPIILKGSIVSGAITAVKPKRRLARGDRVSISIESLHAADGQTIWLRGEKSATGGNHVQVMTGAVAASGVLFFPAAPFFLLLHGKEASIPEGTELIAYVYGDVLLQSKNFTDHSTGGIDTTSAF